jgi:hypothetical protein
VSVKGFGTVNYERNERRVELFKKYLRKASANITDGLVCVVVGVVGSEKEGTIYRSTFSSTIVGSKYNKIERITNTSKVVFFDLH